MIDPVVAPTLDRAVLEDMVKIVGPSMVPGLRLAIAQYLEQIPVALAALRTAIADHDPESLRQAAHALRSSSLNLGALRMAQICEQVEDWAIAADRDTTSMASPPTWDAEELAQKILDLEQAAAKTVPLLADFQF